MYWCPHVPGGAEKVTGKGKEYVIKYLDQSNWNISNTGDRKHVKCGSDFKNYKT